MHLVDVHNLYDTIGNNNHNISKIPPQKMIYCILNIYHQNLLMSFFFSLPFPFPLVFDCLFSVITFSGCPEGTYTEHKGLVAVPLGTGSSVSSVFDSSGMLAISLLNIVFEIKPAISSFLFYAEILILKSLHINKSSFFVKEQSFKFFSFCTSSLFNLKKIFVFLLICTQCKI